MSIPTICEDSLSVISSQVSEDGATLSDLQDGPILARLGLVAARANLSARQAKAAGLLMSGICGQSSIGSQQTADLSQLWVSRLQAPLDLLGSTLFKLIWKIRRTPAGRSIYALRASGLRISGNVCTGVPTPQAHDVTGRSDHQKEIHGTKHGCACLVQTVKLASLATPTQRDWKDTGNMSQTGVNPDGSVRNRLDLLGRQAQLADIGETATGGTAPTKSSGQLNPDYSRWLMGFPAEWGSCADTATQSSRDSRRNSSKRRKGKSK
jgi:hypothetical protein